MSGRTCAGRPVEVGPRTGNYVAKDLPRKRYVQKPKARHRDKTNPARRVYRKPGARCNSNPVYQGPRGGLFTWEGPRKHYIPKNKRKKVTVAEGPHPTKIIPAARAKDISARNVIGPASRRVRVSRSGKQVRKV